MIDADKFCRENESRVSIYMGELLRQGKEGSTGWGEGAPH